MTSEYGAASQLEKIDMLDLAAVVVLNKFDKRGADDALRDVRKQWRRNRVAFRRHGRRDAGVPDDREPVRRPRRQPGVRRALPRCSTRAAGDGAARVGAADRARRARVAGNAR